MFVCVCVCVCVCDPDRDIPDSNSDISTSLFGLSELATYGSRQRKLSCLSIARMFDARAYGTLLTFCCVVFGAIGQRSRLTEQPIDLLPPSNSEVAGVQAPRHLSGYFAVSRLVACTDHACRLSHY